MSRYAKILMTFVVIICFVIGFSIYQGITANDWGLFLYLAFCTGFGLFIICAQILMLWAENDPNKRE